MAPYLDEHRKHIIIDDYKCLHYLAEHRKQKYQIIYRTKDCPALMVVGTVTILLDYIGMAEAITSISHENER